MTNELKMKLIELNETIDMMMTALEVHEDKELSARVEKLLAEREDIIKHLHSLN